MIKRIFIIVLSLFIFLPVNVFAGDDWSDYNNIDKAWDGQKTITNKQSCEKARGTRCAPRVFRA